MKLKKLKFKKGFLSRLRLKKFETEYEIDEWYTAKFFSFGWTVFILGFLMFFILATICCGDGTEISFIEFLIMNKIVFLTEIICFLVYLLYLLIIYELKGGYDEKVS